MSLKSENLNIFFSDFAVVAELDSEESELTEIKGILDEEYTLMFDSGYKDDGLQTTEGRQITFAIQSVEATDIHHGDGLEIEGRTYEIVGIQPFDDGKLTDLILKEID